MVRKVAARVLTEERLYRAFIAGLRLHGHTFVDTRQDDHHRRFSLAVEVLDRAHEDDDPSAARMPRGILPSPFTGRYSAFDRALLLAQETGVSGARNPYYPGADLQMSEHRAEHVLAGFTPEERQLLDRMVAVFDQGQVADAAVGRPVSV